MFKGVLSPVVGLAGLNALLFVSYGSLLRYLHPPVQETQPTLWQIYLAGAGAGVACFFFSTPTELVKIQAQMTKLPKSTFQITREIYATHGWKGFYQGGLITMIRDAPSYGLYFLAYEGMKRTLDVSGDDHAWKLLLAGGVAGTVSWASIYPVDVIKSRLQMPSQESLLVRLPYRSIKDCVVRSYRSEGSGVFFRGLWPTLLRGFPVNAVTFYVYEVVMNLLEPNTL
ncbi:mitochondrial carrier domain-containing protein [Choanephora cucurbitarum]|nr:mitochondrial carrier domain-containing protein [Choanephora cucurbitarum]